MYTKKIPAWAGIYQTNLTIKITLTDIRLMRILFNDRFCIIQYKLNK